MTRRLGRLATVLLAIVVLAACGPGAVATPEVRSPVDGVVVAVDARSLTDVRGFTLRTAGGQSFDFTLGDLENATHFTPSHLKEHQATSLPIRVWFMVQDGERIAYRLEDAPVLPVAS